MLRTSWQETSDNDVCGARRWPLPHDSASNVNELSIPDCHDDVQMRKQQSLPAGCMSNASEQDVEPRVGKASPPSRGAAPQQSASPGKRSNARRQRRQRQTLGHVSEGHPNQEEEDPEVWDQSRCDELLAQLDADKDKQLAAIHNLHNSVWTLSKDRQGCRVVQKALKVAPKNLNEELVLELQGHILDAIDSPHANYVIQLVVEVMPVAHVTFVAEEILGVAARVARHRYGCRVIIRLLEHSATEASTVSLVEELLTEAPALLRHSYGHFVLQAVLEHGLPCHKHCIALALQGQDEDEDALLLNANNRHASCVVETALMYCSQEDTESLCEKTLAKHCNVLALAENPFGCYVLNALLALRGKHAPTALSVLHDAAPQLQESKPGRRLLALLGFD